MVSSDIASPETDPEVVPPTLRSLDEIDRQIIAVLQANGREPISSLANKVGLSRNATRDRLDRLERAGVIAGYSVRLGQPIPGSVARAYMLMYLGGAFCERVLPEVARIPEVKTSQSLSGEIDMIAYVEGDSLESINHVRDALEKINGVKKVVTLTILVDRFDRR